MVYRITKNSIFPILRCFIKKVDGLENIPKEKNFIIASNHVALFDPLAIISIVSPFINKKIHYIAKRSKYWHIFGDTISTKWAGCIPYEPGKEKAAYENLTEHVHNGQIIGIFPTGTRNFDGKFTKAKTGAARIAIETKTPILPIGLIYDSQDTKKIFPKNRSITVKIGKIFYFKEYYNKEITPNISEKATKKLMDNIGSLIGIKYDQ